ncbi:MAG: TIGR03546 family protein [Gammaproteobacteria bacterium]|nr:TIGR03546 family protein [Gammaproteobacteria bacterium]
MLGQITKLIKAFNSDIEPEQISLGIAFAMIVGFTPLWSLHNLLVLFLVFMLKVNGAAFTAGIALFALLGYLLDPLFHHVGLLLLQMDALNGLWVWMYNSTLWRIENFNNTIVMGSLVISLLLFVPVYLSSIQLISKYRVQLKALIEKLKLTRFMKVQNWASKVRSYIRWGQ